MEKLREKLEALLGSGGRANALLEAVVIEGAYTRFDTNWKRGYECLRNAQQNLERIAAAIKMACNPHGMSQALKEALAAVGKGREHVEEILRLVNDRPAVLEGALIYGILDGPILALVEDVEEACGPGDGGEQAQEVVTCQGCHYTMPNCQCGKDDTDGAVVHEVN